MNTYHLGSIPVTDELYHHGIKGQKWGIRRYQNEDGSLTAEGIKRYGKGGLGEYGRVDQSLFRRLHTGDWALGINRTFDRGEQTAKKMAKDFHNAGQHNAAKAMERTGKMYEKSNIARDKYLSNTSTGKMVLQNMLMSPIGGRTYREFRSQDNSRGKAFAKTMGSMVVPYGVVWAPEVGKKHKFG